MARTKNDSTLNMWQDRRFLMFWLYRTQMTNDRGTTTEVTGGIFERPVYVHALFRWGLGLGSTYVGNSQRSRKKLRAEHARYFPAGKQVFLPSRSRIKIIQCSGAVPPVRYRPL